MKLHKRNIRSSNLKELLEKEGVDVKESGDHIFFACWKCGKEKLYFNVAKNIGDCKVCAEPVYIKDIFKHYKIRISKHTTDTTTLSSLKRKVRKIKRVKLFHDKNQEPSGTWSLRGNGLPASFNFIKARKTSTRNARRYSSYKLPLRLKEIYGTVPANFFYKLKTGKGKTLAWREFPLRSRGYSIDETAYLIDPEFMDNFFSFLHKRSLPYVNMAHHWNCAGTDPEQSFYIDTFLRNCNKRDIYLCNQDYYKDHIIIPVSDEKKNCVGFQARDLDPKSERKYKFPKGFSKSKYLYNIDIVKPTTSAVSIFENAFNAMTFRGVATFGKTISQDQIDLLLRQGPSLKEVFLFFDDDAWLPSQGGGPSAVRKAVEALSPYYKVYAIKLNRSIGFHRLESKEYSLEPEILSVRAYNEIKEVVWQCRRDGRFHGSLGRSIMVNVTLMSSSRLKLRRQATQAIETQNPLRGKASKTLLTVILENSRPTLHVNGLDTSQVLNRIPCPELTGHHVNSITLPGNHRAKVGYRGKTREIQEMESITRRFDGESINSLPFVESIAINTF